MSHFTVLVVWEDVEQQLAPFQENNMGDCPKEYLKFYTYPKDSTKKRYFDSRKEAKKELWDLYDAENSWLDNPNSKWDRYEVWGRRAWSIKVKENCKWKYESPGFSRQTDPNSAKELLDWLHTDSAILQDIENIEEIITFAVLKDGKRYERWEMWRWWMVSNEKDKDQWEDELRKLLFSLDPETRITIVDCHI